MIGALILSKFHYKFCLNVFCLATHSRSPFYKIIVPTIDTVRYEYVVTTLLSGECPVLLVGNVGTGKTSTAVSVTESKDKSKYSVLNINISAQVSFYLSDQKK